MKKMNYFLIIPIALMMTVACKNDKPGLISDEDITQGVTVIDPVSVTKSNSTKLYVHYMPWFESKEISGEWGMHWTMANKNPDNIDASGKREIAAHFYPLAGAYDSSDEIVLDYHLLLMKYAGIEGVLVDWYGARGDGEKVATETLLAAVERAGMEIAIVYEDRNNLDGASSVEQMVTWGQEDMRYLEKNFFSKECYAKVNGQPLLMCFGPIALNKGDYSDSPARWTQIFSVLSTKPFFVPLYGTAPNASDSNHDNVSSEFTWVDPNTPSFYQGLKDKYGIYMASAYPGFYDYYEEGGWGEGYEDVDYRDGDELREQLQVATDAEAPIMQLVTWNDFGEGTQIEPTEEDQYKYLEIVQDYAGVTYDVDALKQIYRHFELRKQYQDNIDAKRKLLQAYYYLNSLQIDEAKQLMDEIE